MRQVSLLGVAAMVCYSATLASAQSVPGVTETSLGRVPGYELEPGYALDAHGWNFAVATRHDKGWQIWLNGQLGPAYESIGKSSLSFSQEGRHLAYAAKQGGKWFVVVDGQQAGPPFDGIGEGSIVFSPDSKRLAYHAKQGKKWVMVVDGTPGPQFDKVWAARFSPDCKRVAYWAERGERYVPVVDGQEGPELGPLGLTSEIKFSEDSQRWICVAFGFGQSFLVVDGQRQPFDPVYAPSDYVIVYSTRTLVYAAAAGPKQFMVVDGEAGPPYDAVGAPVMSPDDRRMGYRAVNGKKAFAVVDGQAGPAHDAVGAIAFSRGGLRVAYEARQGKKWFVVTDAQPGPEYDDVRNITFSPDGTRVAYRAKQGKDWLVVVDGQPGRACRSWGSDLYPSVGEPTFSADSKHVWYWASQGKELITVVDGQEGPYLLWIAYRPDGSKRTIASIETSDKKTCVAIDGKVGPPYDTIRCLTLPPGGGRVIYLGRRKNHWVLVVDGQEAGEYRGICTAKYQNILAAADWPSALDEKALDESFQADGTLSFLATKTERQLSGAELYRITIAPR